jgi:hypothetical protein
MSHDTLLATKQKALGKIEEFSCIIKVLITNSI